MRTLAFPRNTRVRARNRVPQAEETQAKQVLQIWLAKKFGVYCRSLPDLTRFSALYSAVA